MSAFPKSVAITVGRNVHDTKILNAATGEQVPCVRGLKVELDAAGKQVVDVTILLCDVAMTIGVDEARYVLDEDTLSRLAADNGFALVAMPGNGRERHNPAPPPPPPPPREVKFS